MHSNEENGIWIAVSKRKASVKPIFIIWVNLIMIFVHLFNLRIKCDANHIDLSSKRRKIN